MRNQKPFHKKFLESQELDVCDQCCGSGSVDNNSGSGSGQLRIRNEFEVKLLWKTDKICQFLKKNAQFKKNSFFSWKISLKSLYFVIMCNLAHLQDGITKVKFVLRILYKIPVGSGYGSETNWYGGSRSEKNYSLLKRKIRAYSS